MYFFNHFIFFRVASSLRNEVRRYEDSDSASEAASHKYLQVELLADENVSAKHGNDTADFMLILANIVGTFVVYSMFAF